MDVSQLTAAQHRALAVMAAAHCGQRPVRSSNRTTSVHDLIHREMLTVQWQVVNWLEDHGYVRVINEWLQTLEFTDTGRALAREAGLVTATDTAGDQLGGSRP